MTIGWATLVGIAGLALWAGWEAHARWTRHLALRALERARHLHEQRRVPDPAEMDRACDAAWHEAVRERERVLAADQSGTRLRVDAALDGRPLLDGKRAPRGGRRAS